MPKIESSFRVVFNTNKDEAQKLILRPEGIEPGASNDVHQIEAVTEASYEGISVTPYGKIDPGSYDLYWKEDKISTIYLPQGGVHTFVINGQNETEIPRFFDFLLTKENSVHMFWIVPQYFVITVGEIMFSITALEFSYSQVIKICYKDNYSFSNINSAVKILSKFSKNSEKIQQKFKQNSVKT